MAVGDCPSAWAQTAPQPAPGTASAQKETDETPVVLSPFVVDASDSVDASGQAAEAAYLAEALDQRPRGARTAVVRFGGDARLAAGLGADDAVAEADAAAFEVAPILGAQDREGVLEITRERGAEALLDAMDERA